MCNNTRSEQAAAQNKMLRNKCEQAADAWGISRTSPLFADFCDHVLQDNISPKSSVYNLLKWWWFRDFLATYEYVDADDLPHRLSDYSTAKLSAMLAMECVTREEIERAATNLVQKQIKIFNKLKVRTATN